MRKAIAGVDGQLAGGAAGDRIEDTTLLRFAGDCAQPMSYRGGPVALRRMLLGGGAMCAALSATASNSGCLAPRSVRIVRRNTRTASATATASTISSAMMLNQPLGSTSLVRSKRFSNSLTKS